MASTDKTWGITPPISTTLPTPGETQASNTLFDELKRQGTYETKQETDKRLANGDVAVTKLSQS